MKEELKTIIHNLIEKLGKGFLFGIGFSIGIATTTLLAVAVTGTIKTWTTGEVLSATDLNTTIASLKTAIEGIPNWTKNGTNATYTDGNVGIGTSSPATILDILSAQPKIKLGVFDSTTNGVGGIQIFRATSSSSSTSR